MPRFEVYFFSSSIYDLCCQEQFMQNADSLADLHVIIDDDIANARVDDKIIIEHIARVKSYAEHPRNWNAELEGIGESRILVYDLPCEEDIVIGAIYMLCEDRGGNLWAVAVAEDAPRREYEMPGQ